MTGGPVTTVVGDVVRRVTSPVVGPPDPPGNVGNPPPGKGGKGRSEFEIAIASLDPIAHYRFRDPNFNNRIQDKVPGGKKHLLKQIAAATRSDVKTRTTHPGGALFPSTESADWSTQGTFYKDAADNVLNGATEYTMILSARFLDPRFHAGTVVDHKVFGVATENVSASNLAVMTAKSNGGGAIVHTDTSSQRQAETDVTELVHDGVNRLYIARYNASTGLTLTTSKPGHEALSDGSAASTAALEASNFALVMNARNTTTVLSNLETPGMVIDQAAIFDTDIGATAEADLHSLWTDEVAGAGYYPSMMQFDGSTGFYSHNNSFTSSGNLVTGVVRFNRASFTGDKFEQIMRFDGPTNDQRLSLFAVSSDNTTTPNRADHVQVQTQNSSGTVICRLLADGFLDGEDHVLFYAFDGDNGTAVFVIDGVDADDTGNADRVAPTTGALESGASGDATIGSSGSAGALFFSGKIGFVGYADAYLTNYEDFMDGNLPKPIDEKDWTEFGSQPLFWSHTGQLDNSKGSAGDMTKNGSIVMTTGGSP